MSETVPTSPSRGRPPSITRERLADAGIALTLPKMTMVGVADQLGVSAMALYKHVSGLEALKELVAEEIFLRWPLPRAQKGDGEGFSDHLERLSVSMWTLVAAHPGIAPYLLREDMITAPMMDKIRAHQHEVAAGYCLPFTSAQWALFTVAYHCVAVADTILPAPMQDSCAQREAFQRIPDDYAKGIAALILGILAVLDNDGPERIIA